MSGVTRRDRVQNLDNLKDLAINNGKIFQNVQVLHTVSPGNSTHLQSYSHLKYSQFTLVLFLQCPSF